MIVTLDGCKLGLIKNVIAYFKEKGFPCIQIQNGEGDAILAILGFGANNPVFIPSDSMPDGVKYFQRNDGYFTIHYEGFVEVWEYIAEHERQESIPTS